MASSLFYLALVLFAGVASANNARIIGGSETAIEAYPSVVQVETLNQGMFWLHYCGGSILNAIHVLSAAHCFTGSQFAVENRRIRAGTATMESNGVIVHVAEVFNHPSYGQNGNDGDIAVVRLSSAFLFTNTLNSANFVASGTTLPAGMLVTKLGWGAVEAHSQDRSPVLRDVNVVVANQQNCRDSYASLTSSPEVTSNMFCAGSTTADSCYGDGGGPVFVGNVVVGVISWGNGCLLPGYPGVNTAVSAYSNWIVEVVMSA